MRRPFLQASDLYWCDRCHVPVLAARCACGAETRSVPLTPPGDIRPAFPADVERINRIYQEHFGIPLVPDEQIALLNKVPDEDRMEEVILGGAVVANVRFQPSKSAWEPIPRPAAFALGPHTRHRVIVDDTAAPSIREGASVLAPGLAAIDDDVRTGDEVVVYSKNGETVGVGRAKISAFEARSMDRGQIVRMRKNVPGTCIPGPSTWDGAVAANAEVLEQVETDAVRFVREVAERHPIQPSVSYSGGKDSLATLLVVLKALGKVPIIFADSGLEFEETCENVRTVADRYGVEIARAENRGKFWETFKTSGPPAVNARWCCAVCKLTPVNEMIGERWGDCLSFIGQRKYESFKRAASKRVWRNPKTPRQLAAAPIQHWTALHVWLYLFREKAPYNILYDRGLDRIGCFMCPSSDRAVMAQIRETHPRLWHGWEEALERYATDHGLPQEWVAQGRWRLRGDEAHG